MKNSQPLVSIGLPVYNGQNYLDQAIRSVLDQNYQNFELIISDNGSTDNTRSICEKFLNMDERIQYFPLDKNYGAAINYNRTFKLSRGKYFKWLAHDDLLAPANISKSVNILESFDEVVLCGCQKKIIDARGEVLDQYNYEDLKLDAHDPVMRYNLLLKYFRKSFTHADFVFGLIHTEKLKDTDLIGNYSSADFTLLVELILKGKFYVIDEPLFLRRLHPGMSMAAYNNQSDGATQSTSSSGKMVYKSHAEVAKWYDPGGKVRYIPHFKWLNELMHSITKNKFPLRDKIKLLLSTYKWFCNRLIISIKNNVQKRLFNQINFIKNESRNFSWRTRNKVG